MVTLPGFADGSLRDLDRLTTNALRLAARRKLELVNRDLVLHIVERDNYPTPRVTPSPVAPLHAAGPALVTGPSFSVVGYFSRASVPG